MNNVEAIGPAAITPRFVLEQVLAHEAEIGELFIVSFDLQGLRPRLFSAGDPGGAALAAALLNDYALDCITPDPG